MAQMIALFLFFCLTGPLAQANSGGGCGAGAAPAKPQAPEEVARQQREQLRFVQLNMEVVARMISAVAGPDWRPGRVPRSRAALVSRAGQNMSRGGNAFSWARDGRQRVSPVYSHAGWLVYDGQGKFAFKHLLNECSGPTSSIFVESPLSFISQTAMRFDLRVTVPGAGMQQALFAALRPDRAGVWAGTLHHPEYNGISNPLPPPESGGPYIRYQNSNQWALSVYDFARTGRVRWDELLKFWADEGIFRPMYLRLGPLNRLAMGGKIAENFRLDDHPNAQWLAFVAADSVHEYIKATSPGAQDFEICPSGSAQGEPVCGRAAAEWLKGS